MAKTPNQNIGHIECERCRSIGAVRKNKNGLIYYICRCGKVNQDYPEGQEWMMDNARLWSEGKCPDNLPDWIKLNKGAPPRARPEPAPALEPVAEKVPEKVPEPVIEKTPEPAPALEPEEDDYGILGFG